MGDTITQQLMSDGPKPSIAAIRRELASLDAQLSRIMSDERRATLAKRRQQLDLVLKSRLADPLEIDNANRICSSGQSSGGFFSARESDIQRTVPAISHTVPEVEDGITALRELGCMVGLKNVKFEIKQLADFVAFQQKRKRHGLRDSEMSLHMVFLGNPGTGKTAVARIVAKIYQELGVLSKGHIVETSRSDLVAGFLGQTAIKTKEVVEQALGGVLFIDEAYSLVPTGGMDFFGREALDTLLKMMEDHRGDFAVIAAGYEDEMSRFLNANPGLQSRFGTTIRFMDYTPEELLTIFDTFCREADYSLSAGARAILRKQFDLCCISQGRTFGNARTARNIFDCVRKRLATRIAGTKEPDKAALSVIEESDILPLNLL